MTGLLIIIVIAVAYAAIWFINFSRPTTTDVLRLVGYAINIYVILMAIGIIAVLIINSK